VGHSLESGCGDEKDRAGRSSELLGSGGDRFSRAQVGHSLESGCGDENDRAGRLSELLGSGGDRKGDLEAPKLLLRRLVRERTGLRLTTSGEDGLP